MSFSGAVIGLDLGTQNCVISQAKRGGIDTVLNEASKRTTAAMVSFQGSERFLGDAAAPISKSNFKNTVRYMKRIIGRKFKDPQVQKELDWMPNKDKFVELPSGDVGVVVNYNDEQVTFTCEQVMAMLINRLRGSVDKNDLPNDVVLSVPGWWNEKQRRALLDSCQIAGFQALRLLNDHTAAALSYGIYKSARNVFDPEKQQIVMFIDIGFSNMSVSVVGFVQGKLQVLSCAFLPNLGGRDFDAAIFNKFVDEFKEKRKLDVRSDAKATLKLMEACEKAKQTLTPEGVNLANVHVEYLMEEIDFTSQLSLEEFSQMSEPLLKQMQAPIDKALADAGLKHEEVEFVEIIGGASRPKIVKKAIAEFMHLDLEKPNYGLSTTLNLDESVGRGCALNSAMLSPVFKVKEFNVFDTVVYPVTLTWEQGDSLPAGGESMEEEPSTNSVTILQKKQATPCTKRVTFRRNKDFEISASFDVDEDAKALLPQTFKTDFAKYKVKVGAMKPEEKIPLIRVDFSSDRSGLFKIASAEALHEIEEGPKSEEKKDQEKEKAEEEKKEEKKVEEKQKKKYKKVKLTVESKNIYGLPEAEITKYKSQEAAYSAKDRAIEETGAARNALETYIYSFRDKIDLELKSFIKDDEKSNFSDLLSKEETWLYDEGFNEEKHEYVKRLEKLQSFGSRYEERQVEHEARPIAVQALKDVINKFTEVINSTAEHLDHITEEERTKVRNFIKETEEWLHHQVTGQEKLSLQEDPVLTKGMIQEQQKKLESIGNPVVNKRRPLPPKKEEPKAEKEQKMDSEADAKENAEQNDKPSAEEEGDKAMDVD